MSQKMWNEINRLKETFSASQRFGELREDDYIDRIMSLEQQIKKLEEKLLAESQFRNADFQLIEKLQKRIDELERKMPKKRGRGRPAKKLSDEDFN